MEFWWRSRWVDVQEVEGANDTRLVASVGIEHARHKLAQSCLLSLARCAIRVWL